MVDDVPAAQARALLKALYEHVAEVSEKLEAAEGVGHRTSARGAAHDQRRVSALRRDLYEAHRYIDGLHRRFPQTCDPSQLTAGARHRSLSAVRR